MAGKAQEDKRAEEAAKWKAHDERMQELRQKREAEEAKAERPRRSSIWYLESQLEQWQADDQGEMKEPAEQRGAKEHKKRKRADPEAEDDENDKERQTARGLMQGLSERAAMKTQPKKSAKPQEREWPSDPRQR